MFNLLKKSQTDGAEQALQFICQKCSNTVDFKTAKNKCSNCGNKLFKVAEFRFQGPKFDTYNTDRGKPQNLYNLDWNNPDVGYKMNTPGSVGFQNSRMPEGEQGNMGESFAGPNRRDTTNDQFSRSLGTMSNEDALMDDSKFINSDVSSNKYMDTSDTMAYKGEKSRPLSPSLRNNRDSDALQNKQNAVDKKYKGHTLWDRIREQLQTRI